jgi:hypothetical protein
MQLEKVRSYIAAKGIYVFVLQWQSVCQVCVTLFLLALP